MPVRPEAMRLFNQGCEALAGEAHHGAAALFRRALSIEPGLVEARYNLAICLQSAGDEPGAIEAYQQVVAAEPEHTRAAFNLGGCLQRRGDRLGAAEAYRLCITYNPEYVSAAYNLASLLLAEDEYDESTRLLEDLHKRHPQDERFTQNLAMARWRGRAHKAAHDEGKPSPKRVLVACMPKSGSTFLADAIAKLPGMCKVHLVPEYGRREQELDLEQLVIHKHLDYVTQLHIKPSSLTQKLCEQFSIRPLFLFRNIYDVMASLRDHMFKVDLVWSMARVEPAFHQWDEERQYEFLAVTMMPWFVDFYVSWYHAPDRMALSYEELMADQPAALVRIAEWAGVEATPQQVKQALAETGQAATFNKGGSGRGKAVPRSARAHVERLAGYYPDVDFAPLLGG